MGQAATVAKLGNYATQIEQDEAAVAALAEERERRAAEAALDKGRAHFGKHGWAVVNGDCVAVMAAMDANSVDAIVTDPPAGISFMNKAWDHDRGGRLQWIAWMRGVAEESLRIAKPGAHAFVWALPRTSHWTATAWEEAGWEVRDRVSHLFGTGFPKSMDVSKAIDKEAGAVRKVVGKGKAGSTTMGHGDAGPLAGGCGFKPDFDVTAPATDAAQQWQGWGTALKPAAEDWWLLRKPISERTVAANVQRWGTGALNIDACRVGSEVLPAQGAGQAKLGTFERKDMVTPERVGRFPANVVLDGAEASAMLDEQSGTSKDGTAGKRGGVSSASGFLGGLPAYGEAWGTYGGSGGASRFFYSAKVSSKERGGSTHPCMKPISLMRWLVRMLCPPGGLVLDPFTGSGSTLVAAREEGVAVLGIEREPAYAAIATKRTAAAKGNR